MSGVSMGDATPVLEAPSRVARLLRWLGTGAVTLSGVVFLLQGLDDVDTLIRTYACLLLMGLLTACGIATRALLDDARSARLLLGLAVALVPIQFAQLGGMLHSLASGAAGDSGASALTELFGLHARGAGTVSLVAVATWLVAPLAAFAGLSVLVRPAARLLTFVLLLQSALLLLPFRDSIGGFAVLAVLTLLTPLCDRMVSSMKPRFATPEGRAVRGILLIPVAIAAVRLGFHVEETAGVCVLMAICAGALVYAGHSYVLAVAGRELLYLAGVLLAQMSWLGWIAFGMGALPLSGAVVLIPAAGLFIAIGRLSSFGSVYRLFATTCLAAAAVTLVQDGGLTGDLLALCLGLLTAACGFWRRDRWMVLAGPVITAGATATLAVDAWQHMEINSWVALAAAGVLLVLCASVVERFGRNLLDRARDGWAEVRQWP